MTARRLIFLSALFVIACLTVAGIQLRAQGGATPPAPAAQGGRGGGGQGAGGGLAKGTTTPMKADARGWGWAVKASVDPKHLPLYNVAKQHLLDGKKVTS